MEWKDISSFSQGQKDRTPTTFEAKFGKLRLVVTRHIHHEPTDWLIRCDPFFAEVIHGDKSAGIAKQISEKRVFAALTEHLDMFGS